MKTIHITTGDPDGVGLEVSLKALKKIGPQRGIQFTLWRSNQAPRELLSLTDGLFFRINPLKQKNLEKYKKENIFLDIPGSSTPTKWVARAAQSCLKNKNTEALVTGPLSKTQMQKELFPEKGHTHLLKKLSETEHVFMTFLGKCFHVTLLTDHEPLKKINWTKNSLNKCIALCLQLQQSCSLKAKNKKIALLGLNPHAGEEGLLGKEEFSLKKEIQKWNNQVEGPLVPDVAFLKKNQKKYFLYICLYHDQGLIPFKMIHERDSFQFSLGLPFIRTSVSHGTAKDIFGKNKANSQSMEKALLWTIRSLRKNKTLWV
ncbi:MAG: 4-hydroxythreonine-4-phosphate dehydrogenase PdxA [Bdellovibrionales bacterium]|nr:4-hydroxythreonine-4-phosphate dehydrogenase PdxA [Bdellovibrionales bacterium]